VEGREGMIAMHLFAHSCFWVIPLPDGVTSVGVVGTQAFFNPRTEDLDAFFGRAGAVSVFGRTTAGWPFASSQPRACPWRHSKPTEHVSSYNEDGR
jgi:hypothetical protein